MMTPRRLLAAVGARAFRGVSARSGGRRDEGPWSSGRSRRGLFSPLRWRGPMLVNRLCGGGVDHKGFLAWWV